MKVLVTGGAGFIGSHTADLLLGAGYGVRVIDSLEPPVHLEKRKPEYIPVDIEFINGDVRNKSDMEKALKGIDAVFHLASYMNYLPDFSKFAHVNDFSTALIYEIIVSQNLPVHKVVLASSQAVYGEARYNCATHGVQYPSPRPLDKLEKGIWDIRCPICNRTLVPIPTDESTVNPHNQYAVSKYCQELYALTLGKRYSIPTVALRYSITQGPRQSFKNAYSGILRVFTLRMINGFAPPVFEDGNQLRDYVYVADVATANLLALENENTDYQVYNVGGCQALSVSEYASLIGKLLGIEVSPQMNGEFRLGDTRHVISDISKLRALGWEPETSVEKIAREYIDWVKEQPGAMDHYGEAEKTMKELGTLRPAHSRVI